MSCRILIPSALLCAVCLILASTVTWFALVQLAEYLNVLGATSDSAKPDFVKKYQTEQYKRLSKNLSENDRIFVFGASPEHSRLERSINRMEKFPDDADVYADYLDSLMADEKPLPQDMLAIGEKLDAGNTLYAFLAFNEKTKHLAEKKEPLSAEELQTLREAFDALPENTDGMFFNDRRLSLVMRWGDTLREPQSIPEQIDNISLAFALSLRTSKAISNFWECFSKYAGHLDSADLQNLENKWMQWAHLLTHPERPRTLLEVIVAIRFADSGCDTFSKAWADKNDPARTELWESRKKQITDWRESLRSSLQEKLDFSKKYGSLKENIAIPVYFSVGMETPSTSELHPGRMLEYVWAEKLFLASLVFYISIVAILCFFATIRLIFVCRKNNIEPRPMSVWRDGAVIATLGFLIPLFLYIAGSRLPFGFTKESLLWQKDFLPVSYAAATYLLWMPVSRMLIYFRPQRRKWTILWYSSVIFLGIVLVASGFLSRSEKNVSLWVDGLVGLIAGIWMIGVLIAVLKSLIKPKERAWELLTRARTLQVALAVLCVLSAVSIHTVLRWQERKWVREDKLLGITFPLERKLASQRNQELAEIVRGW